MILLLFAYVNNSNPSLDPIEVLQNAKFETRFLILLFKALGATDAQSTSAAMGFTEEKDVPPSPQGAHVEGGAFGESDPFGGRCSGSDVAVSFRRRTAARTDLCAAAAAQNEVLHEHSQKGAAATALDTA